MGDESATTVLEFLGMKTEIVFNFEKVLTNQPSWYLNRWGCHIPSGDFGPAPRGVLRISSDGDDRRRISFLSRVSLKTIYYKTVISSVLCALAVGGSCSDHLLKDLDQMHQLMPVADPGEGPGGPNPPLFSKNIYWEMPPPLIWRSGSPLHAYKSFIYISY